MADLTPSLVDLYRNAANPAKTNKDKINIQRTAFQQAPRPAYHQAPRPAFQQAPRPAFQQQPPRQQAPSRPTFKQPRPAQKSSAPPGFQPPKSAEPAFFSDAQSQFVMSERNKEKSVLLHELNRMQAAGSEVTRKMSYDNKLEEIKWEFNRTKQTEDCQGTVNFMKDAIKLGCTGIELFNKKVGWLKLEDPHTHKTWSDEACKDMTRYDRSLTKLYQRYIRKGSVSPWVELGFLLVGSLMMTHFKNMFATPSAPAAAGVHTTAPSRNVPFSMPQQQQRAPMPPPTAMRAPMLPPTSMRAPMPAPAFQMPAPATFQMPPSQPVQVEVKEEPIEIEVPTKGRRVNLNVVTEVVEDDDDQSTDVGILSNNNDVVDDADDDQSSVGSLTF